MAVATSSPHTFHIPVMGTGFMIDAPLRVAKYGISSTLSLVDDVLIEQMRKFHCASSGEPYEEISDRDDDARARRITAYLDLLDRLVRRQVEVLQALPFEPGSEITRYFEMLPPCPLRQEYLDMLSTSEPGARAEREARLRPLAAPGSIDVNIMSKGDRDVYRDGQKLPSRFSDASAALRGFALSTLNSSVVLSAGMNPRLYSYAAELPQFSADDNGALQKKITLKVSDFHSAVVQGKFLAKRGLWVSEYRIESGLNCGGHVFATRGLLLGPILEEFLSKKEELLEQLHAAYDKALVQHGRPPATSPLPVRFTVQGGIGTRDEDAMLREHYGIDGTGWATPFLLVPEVTNVDDETLQKLCNAHDDDVYLSDSSPFGLPFWNLRNSASEDARRRRIAEGRPGSPCIKGYVRLFNTEFTALPICTASREYQELKLRQLDQQELTEPQRSALRQAVLAKSCICHDLAGGVTLKNGIDRRAAPAVCPGPNIVNFSGTATLEEMVGHIYGRTSLLTNPERPHMFIRELEIYLDYFRTELARQRLGLSRNATACLEEFQQNLRDGVEYYRRRADQLAGQDRDRFLQQLETLRSEVERLFEDRPAVAFLSETGGTPAGSMTPAAEP